jgi:hypothetical protein
MKSTAVIPVLAFLFLQTAIAPAQPRPTGERAGDRYELVRSYETRSERGEGSSGSSQGHDTLVERVVSVRSDGLELEYDLPKDMDAQARASNWQFPVRVFRPNGGTTQLLNRPDLEARVDRWLKKGKMSRAACGHWVFTWTAIKIECDPDSAVAIVESYDLRSPELREGNLHREKEALAAAPLTSQSHGREGSTFVARMEIDPAAVRRGRAESDVAAGEILGKPVTFEAAAELRAKEVISGTMSVTFATDRAGRVKRRTKVVKLEIREADGRRESNTATETLERRLVSGRPQGR